MVFPGMPQLNKVLQFASYHVLVPIAIFLAKGASVESWPANQTVQQGQDLFTEEGILIKVMPGETVWTPCGWINLPVDVHQGEVKPSDTRHMPTQLVLHGELGKHCTPAAFTELVEWYEEPLKVSAVTSDSWSAVKGTYESYVTDVRA